MSAPDNIYPDESTCDSEDFALGLLQDGADAAQALVRNLSKADADALSRHPVVVVGHALLVHFENHADERYQQGQALIEELKAISKSLKFLAPRLDSADPSNELKLGSTQTLSDYARLKELMELARPAFSDAQYEEAIVRLSRLAGA